MHGMHQSVHRQERLYHPRAFACCVLMTEHVDMVCLGGNPCPHCMFMQQANLLRPC